MRKAVNIILLVIIAAAAIVLWRMFRTPAGFERERVAREAVAIEHLKDIRTAQNAYLTKYGRYTGSIDTLVSFMLTDSVERSKTDEMSELIAVRSLIRNGRLTDREIDSLKYIPYAGYMPLFMEAGMVETYGGHREPVFECRIPYKYLLQGLDQQQLINLIDLCRSRGEYPGLMVGSMQKPLYDGINRNE